MAIDPLTIGLIAGGGQAIGAITNFFGGQSQAKQENEARIRQYKQQMLIRNIRDAARFGKYRTQKVGYQQNLNILDEQYAMQRMQDDLRMNELLKGSAFQKQNNAINQQEAVGKIAARGVSGQSVQLAQQSAIAKIGRQTAAADEKLLGAAYANQLRNEANYKNLNAKRMAEFNKVRFAPNESPVMAAPSMASGPSPFSLIAGLGQAALSGVSAGMSQSNFIDQLGNTNNIGNVPTPNIDIAP